MATTLSRMTKKAASSSVILPLSNRTSPYHRNYTSAIFPTPLKTSTTISSNLSRQVFQRTSIPAHHVFSSLADTILSPIEPKINDAEQELDDLKVSEAAREFPFKIVDNIPGEKRIITLTRVFNGGISSTVYDTGEDTITLSREYQGEDIKVIAYEPHSSSDHSYSLYGYDYEEEEEEYQDYQEEKKEEKRESQNVYLDVSVSKKNGQTLKFDVTANAAAGIKIDSLDVNAIASIDDDYTDHCDRAFMNVKKVFGKTDYNGPRFCQMNENLQKAFHTYLEVRGIMKPSTVKFLYDSLVQKKRKKCHKHLKNCNSN